MVFSRSLWHESWQWSTIVHQNHPGMPSFRRPPEWRMINTYTVCWLASYSISRVPGICYYYSTCGCMCSIMGKDRISLYAWCFRISEKCVFSRSLNWQRLAPNLATGLPKPYVGANWPRLECCKVSIFGTFVSHSCRLGTAADVAASVIAYRFVSGTCITMLVSSHNQLN